MSKIFGRYTQYNMSDLERFKEFYWTGLPFLPHRKAMDFALGTMLRACFVCLFWEPRKSRKVYLGFVFFVRDLVRYTYMYLYTCTERESERERERYRTNSMQWWSP